MIGNGGNKDEKRRIRRIEELLERDDIEVYPAPGGLPYLYRPREVIYPVGESERVVPVLQRFGGDRADRWRDCSREGSRRRQKPLLQPGRMNQEVDPRDLDTDRFFVPPDVSVPAVLDYFRYAYRSDDGSPPPDVAPNHIILGESWTVGEPFDEPDPAASGEPLTGQSGGAGITVGVLDTGIDADADSHPSLVGHFEPDPLDVDVLNGNEDRFLDREAGHGTFIAGIVMQKAPEARFDPTAVLDSMGVGDDYRLAAGIRLMAKRYADVADKLILNVSLGAYTEGNNGLAATAKALDEIDPRILVVAAAGNNDRSTPFFPAASKRVVAVGAITSDHARASFSNFGPWVDCWSFGVEQLSTYVQGTYLHPDDSEKEFGPGSLALWSGTSFSTPRVVGAIAARASERGIGVRQAYDELYFEAPVVAGLGRIID